jgi:LuxR family maltose regulon positive regulatory protein
MTGQLAGVEEKLQAAEAALERMRQGTEPDEKTRNLIGHIAAIRALLAATKHQAERSIAQSQRALEYLHPDNLAVRTATIWKMGIAYQMQGDRNAAGQAYAQAMAISQASGNTIIEMSAATGLGQVQEADNQLHVAAETYRHVQELAGDPPLPFACEAYLGLARIHYQWNKMDAARECGRLSVELARQIESIHTFASCQVFLARLQLTEGDAARAAAALDEADRFVRDRGFARVKPDIAAARVLVLLRQGDLAAAADLAEAHKLSLSRARVCLAQEDPSAALAALEPYRREAGARGWKREQLEARILEAIAHHAHGERDVALEVLADALALAEPGGLIRIFVDEGAPMKELLSAADARRTLPDYVSRLLAAFEAKPTGGETPDLPSDQPLVEPLSPRELEVLQLIAEGLSNREIGERLFIAVSTVKGHNRNIYGKLQVERRTEAVARARDLGLL